jgi:hypothetical protein
MLEPRPSARRWIEVAARAQAALDGDECGSAVAQRVLTRLHQPLGKLIGPVGFDTLLARSLVLARRAEPALAGITAGPGGTLEGLAGLTGEGTRPDEEALAIASHFIELLMDLIGEDLVMRMLRDIWPAESRAAAQFAQRLREP